MPKFVFATLSVAAALAATAGLPQSLELDTIVVTPDRTPTEVAETGSSVSVLTGEDFARDGRPFALQYITELPGVTVNQSGPAGTVSGFSIRGAPQQYNRVYVDGIEITDPSQPPASASLSGFTVDGVSRIEVLRGSQSALYGGLAVGGVVGITTLRATEDGLGVQFRAEGGSFETWRGSLGVTGRSTRGEFALSASRYITDGFSAAEESDGNTEDDGYATTRLSATGTLNLGDVAALSGSAFRQTESGDFDAGAGPGMDAPNTFDTDSWGARLGADFVAFGTVENTLAVTRFEIDRTSDSGFGPFTFEGGRTRIEYLGGWAASPQLELQVGGDYTDETSESDAATESFQNSIAGVFGQAIWSPSDALVVNAALRQDSHSEYGGYTTGRLTGVYSLPSDTVFRGSVATGFRPPSHDELFTPYGDPDFDPETSVSADAGVEQVFASGRGSVGATLFWLEIDNLIEFDLASFTYVQRSGTSESKGLEAAASYALTDSLSLAAAYTYTDATVADGSRRDRIPRHDLSLSLDGGYGPRLSYGVNVHAIMDYHDTTGVESSAFNEDFAVVNAYADYALNDAVAIYLRAENLFDAQYQTARGFSTADQAFYVGLTGQF